MNLFSWISTKKTDTKTIYPILYVAKSETYGLEKSLIVVGFPGGEHTRRIESDDEAEIRNYLDRLFKRKEIKTEKRETDNLPSERRDFRGNGILDRTYHIDGQFHFYESRSIRTENEIINKLKERFMLTPNFKLPNYLVSDLDRLI